MNALSSVSKKSDANKQLFSGVTKVYAPSQLGVRLRLFSCPFESSEHNNLDDCSGGSTLVPFQRKLGHNFLRGVPQC